MDRSQLLFTFVDFFCEPLQNYRKYRGIFCEKDVPYSTKDATFCTTDFYYDPNLLHKTKLPILVNIHGGGFVKGDKSHRHSICGMYATAGWFVVNLNYRLSPQYPYPAALEDIFALLDCLPTFSKKYDLDLAKIVLTGDSAGAYYASHAVAMLTNSTLREAFLLQKPPVEVCGLMSFSGAYNIQQAFRKKIPFGITRVIGSDLVGYPLKKDYSNVADFALAKYFNTADFVTKDWPKTFLTYAKKDFFVGGQGETMAEALREAGVDLTLDTTTSFFENHCYHLTFFSAASKRCMKKALAFLDQIKNEGAEQPLGNKPWRPRKKKSGEPRRRRYSSRLKIARPTACTTGTRHKKSGDNRNKK